MADTPRTIRVHLDFNGSGKEFVDLLRQQVRQEAQSSAQIRQSLTMPPGWPEYCSLKDCPHHPPTSMWRLLRWLLRGGTGHG
ncbi:hypothetical protein [Streptomyces sp. bgisy154]|uniref:hypothetical protein n=1 Tax=Streptomyces sp. bgisy154 TaxID=3413794 RepID=UPI003D7446E5